MTTKRTHGPCTCTPTYDAVMMRHIVTAHTPDCLSLYPAQHEPDALTRLARYARDLPEDDCNAILAIISEAREEQKKATVRATNKGLEDAAEICDGFGCPCAKDIRYLKEPEP